MGGGKLLVLKTVSVHIMEHTKWCSTQALLWPSLPSICHTVSRYIRKCNSIYAHKKSTALTRQYCLYTPVLPLHGSTALTWQCCPYMTVLPLHNSTALTWQYCPYTTVLPLHKFSTKLTMLWAGMAYHYSNSRQAEWSGRGQDFSTFIQTSPAAPSRTL